MPSSVSGLGRREHLDSSTNTRQAGRLEGSATPSFLVYVFPRCAHPRDPQQEEHRSTPASGGFLACFSALTHRRLPPKSLLIRLDFVTSECTRVRQSVKQFFELAQPRVQCDDAVRPLDPASRPVRPGRASNVTAARVPCRLEVRPPRARPASTATPSCVQRDRATRPLRLRHVSTAAKPGVQHRAVTRPLRP
jgi:hypothetical protein